MITWLKRFWATLRPSRLDEDLREELRFHIEERVEENIASGMLPEEARRDAESRFGNATLLKESTRETDILVWLESLMQDVRYAIRSFRRAPAFALTVIGTIGLALGLNTTLFTIFNAYVLRPLEVRDPYSLYQFTWTTKDGDFHQLKPAEFEAFRRRNPVFSDVMASTGTVTRAAGRHLLVNQVSTNTFAMLGIDANIGRPLLPGDSGVLVVSDTTWKNKFGSDPQIVGTKLEILGGSFEIVGVARPEFTGLSDSPPDVWIPLLTSGPEAASRLTVVGRLKPNVTPQQAKAALAVWARQATADLPESERASTVRLESAATSIHWNRKMTAVFAPLLAAFGLVLVIACANVANMMLARAMARQREIGARLSLGAGRARLIRQLLTESFLLAIPAALAGLLISQATIRFIEDLLFRTMPPILVELFHPVALTPDIRVFLFILGAAAASTVLSGLVPAIQATRPGLLYATRGDFSADFHPARLRNALVVSQVTVCVLLLICSGVLLRASRRLQESDVRLIAEGVLEIEFYANLAKIADRLDREPWVESAGSAWRTPLMGPLRTIPVAPGADFVRAGYNFVSPRYFPTFRIPLVRGRNFSLEESRSGAPVVIVSEATAARLWPGQDALGQTLRVEPDAKADAHKPVPAFHVARVIGIAGDVMSGWIGDGIDSTCIYFPTAPGAATSDVLLVRVKGEPEAVRRALDEAISSVAAGSVSSVVPVEQAVAMQIYPFRAASWIASFLGGLALVLSLSGIYGVLSYLVSQRTKEIGIRMALGASTTAVIRIVLSQSMRLAVVGIAIGATLALGVSRLFASQLQNVDTFDALAYIGSILLALVAALAASYVPSRRAANVDPVIALRCD
jgi:predicted permease